MKHAPGISISAAMSAHAASALTTPSVAYTDKQRHTLIDRLIDWGSMALSAQTGYIVSLKSMWQLKRWN